MFISVCTFKLSFKNVGLISLLSLISIQDTSMNVLLVKILVGRPRQIF